MRSPDDGRAQLLATLNAECHSCRPDGLAHAVLTVHQQQRTRVDQHLDLLVGQLDAVCQQLDVERRADHPVTVVTGKVRTHQAAADALGFGVRARGMPEDLGDEARQAFMVDHNRFTGGNVGGRASLVVRVCRHVVIISILCPQFHRNIAPRMEQSPRVHVAVPNDVEHQVGESFERPMPYVGPSQLV